MHSPRKVEETVAELVKSEYFRPKGASCKLLQYLAEKTIGKAPAEERSDSAVAEEFGWEIDTAWKNCGRLRKELDHFYSGEGAASFLRVTVTGGGQGAAVRGQNWLIELVSTEGSPTRRFWAPHLDSRSELELISNAPLFFRSKDGTFRVRAMGINDVQSRSAHEARGEEPKLDDFEECFHYVSLGDFRFATVLSGYMATERVALAPRIVYSSHDMDDHFNPSDDVKINSSKNLIVTGNRRVSWVMRTLEAQLRPNFHIVDGDFTKIHNRAPRKGEEEWLEDKLCVEGVLHAVVLRRVGQGRTDTLINIQNGPALESVVRLLTNDQLLGPVLDQAFQSDPLPDRFELLFEVPIGGKELPRRDVIPRLLASRR